MKLTLQTERKFTVTVVNELFSWFVVSVSEFTRLEGSFRSFPTRIVQRRQALQTDDFLRLRILHQLEPEIPRVPLTLHRRQAQEGRQRGK